MNISDSSNEFSSLGIADYIAVVVMLAPLAAIGIYFRFTGGKQSTALEFLMAGKDMSILPVSFSIMATYLSAVSLLGLPSETYRYGIQFSFISIGTTAGVLFSSYVLIPVYFDIQATTAYEYLERRFGRTLKTVTSGLYIFQWALYMAVVIYGPSLALNVVTGLDLYVSMIAMGLVCIFYCTLGGLKAILWTDVFQAILMYITAFSVMIGVIIKVGGIRQVLDIANDGGRLIFNETSFDPTVRYTLWNAVIFGFLVSVHFFGTSQSQIQRILCVRSLSRAKKAIWCAIPLIVLFMQLCNWNGTMIYAMFHDCDPILDPSNTRLTAKDQIIPYTILLLFGKIPALSGFLLCGIFAAALSSISSAINAMATVTIEDFIKPFCSCKTLSDARVTFISKILVFGYGLLCLLLSLVVSKWKGLVEAAIVANSLVGGPITAVFLLGMLTTTAFEEGVLAALVVGFSFSAWIAFGSQTSKFVYPALPLRTDGCLNNVSDSSSNNITMVSSWNNVTLTDENNAGNNEDVFILYKVSYLWFNLMCIIVTFSTGYLICYATKRFIKRKPVDQLLISPILRKWLFDSANKKVIKNVTMTSF